MAKLEMTRRTGQRDPEPTQLSSDMRVDPPHAMEPQPVPLAEAVGVAPTEDQLGEAVSQRVHAQAAQLAAHMQARQRELDHREAELNSRIAQWESDARTARLYLAEREEALASREVEIQQQPASAKDAGLAEARAALDRLRRDFVQRQLAWEEEVRRQREQQAAAEKEALAELARKRQSVQRRSQQVDQAQAALEQLRADLGRMHRETLEIRLATEELWAQLAGAAPPATLTQSLGRIRARLAEDYRLAEAECRCQRERLEAIRGQLLDQHRLLAGKRQQFERWMASQEERLRQQAARLIAREQEVRRREAELTAPLGASDGARRESWSEEHVLRGVASY